MKINLDMAKNLNLKAVQAQELEDKRLKEIARKKSAFERNLELDIYLWMHGFRVTKTHISQTCLSPSAGHQRTASQKIPWEETRQENYTWGWGWKN